MGYIWHFACSLGSTLTLYAYLKTVLFSHAGALLSSCLESIGICIIFFGGLVKYLAGANLKWIAQELTKVLKAKIELLKVSILRPSPLRRVIFGPSKWPV